MSIAGDPIIPGAIFASKVTPGGLADIGGLLVGDLILEVNGIPTTEVTQVGPLL